MDRYQRSGWACVVLATLTVLMTMLGTSRGTAARPPARGAFESVRVRAQDWIAALGPGQGIIPVTEVKQRILDHRADAAARYQIVSVRSPKDDSLAGHIPHAVNIYWPTLLQDSSLARIDSTRIIVLACYYGHASMICSTILGLLGYETRSLEFGMMGWNEQALVKAPWDQTGDYPVETAANRLSGRFPLPELPGDGGALRAVVLARARAYLNSEGSPVIAASDLKALVDDWPHAGATHQILDVRSRAEYARGHVPHAMWIPWSGLAEAENLEMLDPRRATVVYSDNGQVGQAAATVLNLLGYRAVALKFGMMDWKRVAVDPARQWRRSAGYPVERGGP